MFSDSAWPLRTLLQKERFSFWQNGPLWSWTAKKVWPWKVSVRRFYVCVGDRGDLGATLAIALQGLSTYTLGSGCVGVRVTDVRIQLLCWMPCTKLVAIPQAQISTERVCWSQMDRRGIGILNRGGGIELKYRRDSSIDTLVTHSFVSGYELNTQPLVVMDSRFFLPDLDPDSSESGLVISW